MEREVTGGQEVLTPRIGAEQVRQAAEVLRMLYTDAIPGVQGDDLTTELQSSDEKAVFSATGTLTTPYKLRMQMTWLPAEVETGGSYEFPQTFYVDGRFYTAEKLEFFLSA